MSPQEIFRTVTEALDKAQVPYMLTGSFASSFHGAPRATQDIDIVIAPDKTGVLKLLDQFAPDRFYASREAALDALANQSQFNLIDSQTGWKVDFIIRKARSFSREEFDRRAQVELFGLKIYLAAAEDVIVAKLEWAKQAESDRQIDDAAGIMRTRGKELDYETISYWVDELKLQSQWQKARQKAGLLPRSQP